MCPVLPLISGYVTIFPQLFFSFGTHFLIYLFIFFYMEEENINLNFFDGEDFNFSWEK